MTDQQDDAAAEVADDEIAIRILDHDEFGLRLLLRKYGPKLKAFVRRKFGPQFDDEDLTDILYQVALRAWQYMGSFDDAKGSLGAWLATTAQNEAIDFLQRERLPVCGLEHDPPGEFDEAEMTPERRKLFEDLDQIIEELPPRQRSVAREDLRCGGEADGPSLAKKLGTSPNAVRVARSKARKTIVEKLKVLGHRLGDDA